MSDEASRTATTAWVDASAGVAGDMLLGALVDAGAPLEALQDAVDAVVPGAVRLRRTDVLRAGLRAVKVDVDVLVDDPPHRTWRTIRDLLGAARLDDAVAVTATATFARLAEAEGRVHGTPADDVHFHEVGALDAVADVVGTCAGFALLGVDRIVTSPIATGSGRVDAAHGLLPVPPPAVLELARGWDVVGSGPGELATPTGVALLTALSAASGPLPALRILTTGVGAGTRDVAGRANVVRVVLGQEPPAEETPAEEAPAEGAGAEATPQDAVLLETTVDDLDPRVWPLVMAALLDAGALDTWLTPVLMKKGRPGHLLSALSEPALARELSDLLLAHTSTLGVRRTAVRRDVLDRAWTPVAVADPLGQRSGTVRVKVGIRGSVVVQAMPEFSDVADLAGHWGRPVVDVLELARAAAVGAGLVPGAAWRPTT